MRDPRKTAAFAVLLLFAAVAGAWLIFGSGEARPDGFGASPMAAADPDGAPIDSVSVEQASPERAEVEGADNAPSPFVELPLAALSVRGRVTDTLGNPIAGAEVLPMHRQSLAAMFRGGQGFRGFRGGRG